MRFGIRPVESLVGRIRTLLSLPLLFLFLTGTSAAAESGVLGAEFPRSSYVVGVGEAKKSGDALRDRRAAEVLARFEIAKQIKVQVKSQSIDMMCEGKEGALFPDGQACRNGFLQIVEESVDLFLEGTRIVRHWEDQGIVYAAAVLERIPAAKVAGEKSQEAAEQAKANLEKARGGDPEAMGRAKEGYKKALVYEKEKEVLAGTMGRAESTFKDLENELFKIH